MSINVRAIVRSGVNSINPDIDVVILQSDGFTVDDAGDQIPAYLTAVSVAAQVQPVPSEELKHINNYNVSSVYRYLYIDGDWNSLRRSDSKGGDIIYFQGFEWLVNSKPEIYHDVNTWTKITVIQQKLSEAPAL